MLFLHNNLLAYQLYYQLSYTLPLTPDASKNHKAKIAAGEKKIEAVLITKLSRFAVIELGEF